MLFLVALNLGEYFIRRATNRTDTADFFLENLNQRLDGLFPTRIPSGNTTAERQRSLDERLAAISRQLTEHDRIVILIDGLDEAADSPGFLDCLPKTVPERVLIIYSSRQHPRVRDRAYRALDREHCQEFSLGGLGAISANLRKSVPKDSESVEMSDLGVFPSTPRGCPSRELPTGVGATVGSPPKSSRRVLQ